MKLRNFLKSLWRRSVKVGQLPTSPPPDAPPPAAMQKMLMGLARTEAHELSCDEVYALLDGFADRINRGEDAAALMPLVQHHLEMCPDCREEFEALLKSLQATDVNPG